MKWFYFADGSNPYGIFENRLDLFFKMIVAWAPTIIDSDHFDCPINPRLAYYKAVPYSVKKDALREFAVEYQTRFGEFISSYEDIAWFSKFFETYGKKYGLLREFRENGIC